MKQPVRKPAGGKPTAKAPTVERETAPFVVRGGFVLHHGRNVYRAGEVVDLTEAEADARRHMIELAPDQGDD
nr:hypothetical protein [uncultured Acidocella sp.]